MTEARVCKNIMELLVVAEVKRQKAKLAPQVTRYINSTEVTTYALNRLPPLYASSEEGRKRQIQKAQKQFGQDISIAVRQAFAAVERDPIRASIPIESEEDSEYQAAVNALNDLRRFMSKFISTQDLSWQELIRVNQQLLSLNVQEKPTTSARNIPKNGRPSRQFIFEKIS